MIRVLFAADRPRFLAMILDRPTDIRRHLDRLAPLFDGAPSPPR
jgi:hypothetical protein